MGHKKGLKHTGMRLALGLTGFLLVLSVWSCSPAQAPSLEPQSPLPEAQPEVPAGTIPDEEKAGGLSERAKDPEKPQVVMPEGLITVRTLRVPGNIDWTDTGLDVEEGQRIRVEAAGGISLQKGNPTAYCGPDGYDLRTVQQPLPGNNIGALIGRVVLLISVEVDEETGEETRNELINTFYVGSSGEVFIAQNGRLFLGINESVVGDNSGAFEVRLALLK